MKRVDLELSEFTRRAGSLLVSHTDAGFDRGLEPGEQLLIRDGAQRYRLATVQDISFELTDTHYRLELGAEVDADRAGLLVEEAPAVRAGGIGASEVIALLQEARDALAARPYLAGARHR
ncbi:hypothetical protein P5P86_18295 [Nocardioides sp. BP30]|uniref:hypothetical protein n=1 Tax=Nocardioides sp. BP30 TaxID=3036374 RepID=UPI002469A050|nr:hypothetical protein [Nocardioides sp. BP30]WGL51891.1 hypothetical protein P5P86_18295 [Nocardioides sp. BP30]